MNKERTLTTEKTDYARVALAGFLGVLGIDLIANTKVVLGALSLVMGIVVWNNRKIATA